MISGPPAKLSTQYVSGEAKKASHRTLVSLSDGRFLSTLVMHTDWRRKK